MDSFARAHAVLARFSRWAVWAGGAALLLAAVMVTLDVLARKFLSITMSGSDEITGYVFAVATTWAYSYCLLNRSNVRIDALYGQVPRTVRALLDVFGLLLLSIFIGYLTYKATAVFWTSWSRDSVAITTLATPLWIPQLLWLSGLLLFCFTLLFMLAYTITGLLRGNTALVQRLAGAISTDEEIAQETHGMSGATEEGRRSVREV